MKTNRRHFISTAAAGSIAAALPEKTISPDLFRILLNTSGLMKLKSYLSSKENYSRIR
jgi:hypothetical protein